MGWVEAWKVAFLEVEKREGGKGMGRAMGGEWAENWGRKAGEIDLLQSLVMLCCRSDRGWGLILFGYMLIREKWWQPGRRMRRRRKGE